MSNLESRLYTVLSNDAGVTALASTRTYPVILPQNPTYPAITYQRISGRKMYALGGYTNLENPHIQVDCWAETYPAVESLKTAVIAALRGSTTFAVSDDDDQVIAEDDPNLFRISVDVSCWNVEV